MDDYDIFQAVMYRYIYWLYCFTTDTKMILDSMPIADICTLDPTSMETLIRSIWNRAEPGHEEKALEMLKYLIVDINKVIADNEASEDDEDADI